MSISTDLRFASRMLRKSPLFSGLVILTLALGIGLNTAVFSAVDAILLRPLPGVREPERLVQLYRRAPGIEFGSLSAPEYFDLRDRVGSAFESVATWTFAPLAVTVGDRPQMAMGQMVSANYFALLGARAMMGRTFVASEDSGRGAHPVTVLSYPGWRDRFGSDPAVIGRVISINGRQMEVVGVMEPAFGGTMPVIPPVLYVPLMQMDEVRPGSVGALDRRGNHFMNGIARLAPGASVAQARSHLDAHMADMRQRYPQTYEGESWNLVPQDEAGIHPTMRGAQIAFSGVVLAVVGMLLLIACVNVANLFLARARDRAREMAVRISLGAGRAILVRQLLAESLLFAVVSGLAGLLVAWWAIGLANQITLPIEIDFRPDLRLSPSVLGFTLVVTLVTGLLFGLAPALHATRPSLIPALKGEAPTGASRSRASRGLVVAQTALSIVLLTCAALFLANLRSATTVDKGFASDRVLLGALDPSLQGYDRGRSEAFYQSLLERLRATPGVEHASLTNHVPLGLGSADRSIHVPGYAPREGEGMSIHYGVVGPDYFETMGIPLRSGRSFTVQDDSSAPRAIIVNARFAERFWPGLDPLGRTVRIGSVANGVDHAVVGVVPTGKYQRLGEDPLSYMYLAQAQHWESDMTVVLKAAGDPVQLTPTLRAAVASLDPNVPLAGVRTLNEHLGISLMPARLIGTVLGVFGLLGLALAAVGIYGVMAYSVAQRTREIGIRMAVGSSRGMVVGLIMRQGLTLVAIGVGIGIVGAVGAAQLVRSLLYGEAPLNPLIFAAVPAVLTLVAAVATWVPSRRAAGLDPLQALRTE